MIEQESIDAAAIELGLAISNHQSLTKQHLIDAINHLINHNFEKLISILYRIDVNENKIRDFLSNAGDIDAANIIAELIIERENEKIESRKQYRDQTLTDDDEKW